MYYGLACIIDYVQRAHCRWDQLNWSHCVSTLIELRECNFIMFLPISFPLCL